jgi:hypothetical protein
MFEEMKIWDDGRLDKAFLYITLYVDAKGAQKEKK